MPARPPIAPVLVAALVALCSLGALPAPAQAPEPEPAAATPAPVASPALLVEGLERDVRELKAEKADAEERLAEWSELVGQGESLGETYTRRLDELRDLADEAFLSDRTGTQLEEAYADIKRLAAARPPSANAVVRDQLSDDRALSYELAQDLDDPSQDAIPESLSGETDLLDRYKLLLAERARVAPELRDLLTKTIAKGERLLALQDALATTIADYEDFLLPRLFWIRSASAPGIDSFVEAGTELERAGKELASLRQRIAASDSDIWNPRTVVICALVFLLLPILFVLSGTHLKRVLVPPEGKRGYRRLLALALVVRAALPGLYGLAVTFLIGPDGLHLGVSPLFLEALRKISIIAISFLPLHTALTREGLFVRALEFPPDATVSLRRYVDTIAIAFVVLVTVPALFRVDPFAWTVTPQLSGVAFRALVVLLTWRLLRRRQPLARYVREMRGARSLLWRNWSFLATSVTAVLAGTVIADLLGYRFAAEVIFLATVRSLITLIILGIFYRPARKGVLHLAEKHAIAVARSERDEIQIPEETTRSGDTPTVDTPTAAEVFDHDTRKRATQLVRYAFFLVCALVLVNIWNVDNRLFFNLDAFTVFESPDVTVTLADIATAVGILTLLYVGVRSVPSALELFVFPRIDLDAGLRYATVAIVQYVLLAAGLCLMLLKLQVDFDKLGWLVAALGVGLGFGLQEIVSNFVSGIILLVERPIRVGDIVMVGDTLGVVSRINIRSTTITDWNRLENVYPNKDLITQKVTNWTLTSKMTRVVTPIGVAYGSDPARIKEILLEVARAHPDVADDPAPQALFMSHGDSSLNFELRTYVADIARRLFVEDDMNTHINRALAEEGIEIPFPQRDIHIRSMPEKMAPPV